MIPSVRFIDPEGLHQSQFNLGELRNKDNRAPAVWNAVLAA